MTVMPEAKLAREAEMSYALVALVTDYDCWRQKPTDHKPEPAELMKEIIGNLQTATHNAMTLIRKALELAAGKQEELAKAAALHALQLSIWSNNAAIPADGVLRLKPIWGRYFPEPTAS
jgi:5'-methylthioadenosine phosphorylase